VGGQHGFTGLATYGSPYYLSLYPLFHQALQARGAGVNVAPWGHINYPMACPLGPVMGWVATPLGENGSSPAPGLTGTQGHPDGNVEESLAPSTGARPGRRYPITQLNEGGKYSPSIMHETCH